MKGSDFPQWEFHTHGLAPRLAEFGAQAASLLWELQRSQVETQVGVWLREAKDQFESEIERLFYVAYRTMADLGAIDNFRLGYKLELVPSSAENYKPHGCPPIPLEKITDQPYLPSRFANRENEATTLDFMWLQAPIGGYKADFAICRAEYAVDVDSTDSESWPEIVRVSVPVIVECDGHDFHNRTKEQASYDRERDRFMLARGYRVMRFTGSDLYRDPLKCAKEVHGFLESDESVAKKHKLCLLR